ncbi:MAG: hypothetical protein IT340_01140 [Chloroflexi bacterium]|nr:hypothetical protein [Chloroflexota bacterium]
MREILSEQATNEVMPALERSDDSQQFLAELRAWLAEYGQRLNSVFALVQPSWIEDPAPAIENLRAYLPQPDDAPGLDPAALAAEREQAVAEARGRLVGYPQPVVARFEMLLKAAQTAAVAHEDHNFWIDQRLFYHLRRVILALGERLTESGTLAAVGDVFCLTVDELRSGQELPIARLVRERTADMERFRHVTPPPMLGTMPPFEMSDGGPMLRAMFKGELSPANTSTNEPNQVKGMPGSAGVTRGPARVLHSLAQAGRLQPGDVLVAKATAPPWTPLFATAAAVVTDTGGVLSHSAVVAREYRIPAVVGAGNATTTFADGQLLEVDGTAGIVRVIVEEAGPDASSAGRSATT